MTKPACRACRGERGTTVLDLGDQPPADHFPPAGDAGPDARFALSMWWCQRCGLAQLAEDETTTAEPRGVEPEAVVLQARAALSLVADAGMFATRSTVLEFPSPHGGSWIQDAAHYRLAQVSSRPADVVVDSFGIMHEADQAAGVRRRAAALAPGGVLLLQYQSLDSIVRLGAWSALRHGHFAYYSLLPLQALLAQVGLAVVRTWDFDLYGGTVLLAVVHADENQAVDDSVERLEVRDREAGMIDPVALSSLQAQVDRHIGWLRRELSERRRAGRVVFGYGAASRAAALLAAAQIDATLLCGIGDASPDKHGRRMPGTDVPIVGAHDLIAAHPDDVMLFLPDLLPEVTRAYPELAGRWIPSDSTDVDHGVY